MRGNPYLTGQATVNIQALAPSCNHGLGFDIAMGGTYLDRISLTNAQLISQCLPNFHGLLRLNDGMQIHMLGPIVEMLCQAIGGGYMRVLPGSAKLRPITLKYSCSRVADSLLIIRKQRVIAQWRFKRLIVHRERSFG